MRILSIETSCDETSMALVDFNNTENAESIYIHSHITASQAALHAKYGGVFPAIAKLEHVKASVPLLNVALNESKISISEDGWQNIDLTNELESKVSEILNRDPDLKNNLIEYIKHNPLPKLDAIVVTSGPGLEIALWVGITFAKALGAILNVPVIGANHMLGHLFSPLIQSDNLKENIELKKIPINSLALLVSGGHTQLINIKNNNSKLNFNLIGETIDDAVGEAYDKVARLLNLEYPGGPRISKLAEEARVQNIEPVVFPRPMMHSKDYNFSYSGLKTAVMYHIKKNPVLNENDAMAIALGFENAAIEVLIKKTKDAINEYNIESLLLGGGVSANTHLRNELNKLCSQFGIELMLPISSVCGDNALMIALAGYNKIKNNGLADESTNIIANGTLDIVSID